MQHCESIKCTGKEKSKDIQSLFQLQRLCFFKINANLFLAFCQCLSATFLKFPAKNNSSGAGKENYTQLDEIANSAGNLVRTVCKFRKSTDTLWVKNEFEH